MPRGAPAQPLEALVPYFRGARFALVALVKLRHPDQHQLVAEADRYIEMLDHYGEAMVQTLGLRRDRDG